MVSKYVYIGVGVAIVVAIILAIAIPPLLAPKPGEEKEEVLKPSISDIMSNPSKYKGETVTVNGTCNSIPYYDENTKQVVFKITDGNKSIEVIIAGNISTTLLDLRNIPFPGDYVEVTGVVKLYAGTPKINVYRATDISIKKIEWKPSIVSNIDRSMEYSVVNITGVVKDVSKSVRWTTLVLDVNGTEIRIVVPSILDYMGGNTSKVENLLDYIISSTGVVYVYSGKPVVVVEDTDDIIVHGKYVTAVHLADLKDHVGEELTLTAIVGEIEYKGDYYINLYDGTAIVKARINRDDFIDTFNPFTTGVGSKITVRVTVDSPTLVTVKSISVDEPYPSPLLNISDITEDIRGYTAAVKGTIRDLFVSTSDGGTRFVIFYVDDSTGSIKVFMPGSTYESLVNQHLISEGSEVVLAGYVDIYRGELEIVVYHPEGVQPPDYSVPGKGMGLPVLPKPKPTIVETDIAGLYELSIGSLVRLIDVTVANITDLYGDYEHVAIGVSDDTGFTYVIVDLDLIKFIDPWSFGEGTVLTIEGHTDLEKVWGVEYVVVDAENISVVEYREPSSVDSISTIDLSLKGRIVLFRNVTVVNPYTTKGGHIIFNITDGTSSIKVFISSTLANALDESIRSAVLTAGVRIDLVGFVTEYSKAPEIKLYHPEGIRLSSVETVNATLSQLSELGTGKRVSVTVVFDTVFYENGKYYVLVHDDTGSAYLVFTRDLFVSVFDPWSVGNGSVLAVTGYIGYDERLGYIIGVEQASIVEAVEPPMLAISEVTEELIGYIVIVDGVVENYTWTRGGNLILNITSNGYTITVFIPASAVNEIEESVLELLATTGSQVRFAGYIELYQGRLEIVVYTGSGVSVLT